MSSAAELGAAFGAIGGALAGAGGAVMSRLNRVAPAPAAPGVAMAPLGPAAVPVAPPAVVAITCTDRLRAVVVAAPRFVFGVFRTTERMALFTPGFLQ